MTIILCPDESKGEHTMHTMRGEVKAGRREGRGNGGARSVQGWGRLQIGGAGHEEERTENM